MDVSLVKDLAFNHETQILSSNGRDEPSCFPATCDDPHDNLHQNTITYPGSSFGNPHPT